MIYHCYCIPKSIIFPHGMHLDENKHCWECRRRRLECGGEQPICTKCRTSGVVCPGYGDKKPLVWITPGKVVSRTWKRKNRVQPKEVCERVTIITSPGRELRTDSHAIAEALEYCERPRCRHCYIQETLTSGQDNTCILPETISNHLGTNHFIAHIPSINLFPQSTIHTLISMVISYRLYRATDDARVLPAISTTRQLYRHRQLALQVLSRLIGDEQTASSDETIGAVYTLMFAVLQQSLTPIWRPHFDVFLEIIKRRGGFLSLIQSSPNLYLMLFAFWV